MRKILVGKPILGWVSHTAGLSNREYGKILYGNNDPDKVLISIVIFNCGEATQVKGL